MTVTSPLALAWNPAVGVPMLVAGIIVLVLIWLFGQPRNAQGRRRVQNDTPGERREPSLGGSLADDPVFEDLDRDRAPTASAAARDAGDTGLREELEKLGASLAGQRTPSLLEPSSQAIVDALRAPAVAPQGAAAAPSSPSSTPQETPAPPAAPRPAPAPERPPARSSVGRRPSEWPVERIVTLFVMARDGQRFQGADLIVAAEKAGLEFGDMAIFHRLVDGKREQGPLFSVANMLKPGSFDLTRLESLSTPGLSFFMTLPGPLPALDAWDAMLPTAQRMAELLDGQVLDDERNALGRQRIAHIRDELRLWDRHHEGLPITFGR